MKVRVGQLPYLFVIVSVRRLGKANFVAGFTVSGVSARCSGGDGDGDGRPSSISKYRRPFLSLAAEDDSVLDVTNLTSIATWEEIAIDRSSTLTESWSIGERLRSGETILKVNGLVSEDECNILKSSCRREASLSPGTQLEKAGLVRLPTIGAWERAQQTETPCTDPLSPEMNTLVQELLARVMQMIDLQLPSLVETLFKDDSKSKTVSKRTATSLAELFVTKQLKFSSREPAINVYTAGGEFLAHKDAQALTVLLPFSSPTTDFRGGGTAFWSQDSRGHRVEDPSLLVRPSAGTVLLFGGCVTHAGQPILEGTRVVLVASFSPLPPKGQDHSVAPTMPQRDIYGDSM